jgi:hypothetical protein
MVSLYVNHILRPLGRFKESSYHTCCSEDDFVQVQECARGLNFCCIQIQGLRLMYQNNKTSQAWWLVFYIKQALH